MLFVGTLRSLSTCISTCMLDQRISLECFHVCGPVRNLSVSAATAKTWKKRHFSFLNLHSLKLRILTASANIHVHVNVQAIVHRVLEKIHLYHLTKGFAHFGNSTCVIFMCTYMYMYMHMYMYIAHVHVHGTCQRMRERGWESGLQVCSNGNMAPRQRY